MLSEDDQDIQSRLERISTKWTMVMQAHGQNEEGQQPARRALLHRYRGAVYRYLLAMTREPDLAEELSQQFALKFLEGEFHKASPNRGRFRDYVKTTVINLVRHHHKSQAKDPRGMPDDVPDVTTGSDADGEDEGNFVRQWREEVLDQTWQTLKKERPVYHALLRMRIDAPDLTSREMADHYTKKFSKPMSPANVRKTLERAHTRFADLLVCEIVEQLPDPSGEALRAELQELDLLKYCRSAVERWNASNPDAPTFR